MITLALVGAPGADLALVPRILDALHFQRGIAKLVTVRRIKYRPPGAGDTTVEDAARRWSAASGVATTEWSERAGDHLARRLVSEADVLLVWPGVDARFVRAARARGCKVLEVDVEGRELRAG